MEYLFQLQFLIIKEKFSREDFLLSHEVKATFQASLSSTLWSPAFTELVGIQLFHHSFFKLARELKKEDKSCI